MAVVLERAVRRTVDRPNRRAGLRIRDLVKVYCTGVRANDDITIEVEPGENYGLLGLKAPASQRWCGR